MSLATASALRDPNYIHHKIFQKILFKDPLTLIKENPILKYAGYRFLSKKFQIYKRIEGKNLHGTLFSFKITKIHLGRKVQCGMGLNSGWAVLPDRKSYRGFTLVY